MNPNDVLRALRTLRYSPRKGRRVSIAWIAACGGYGRTAVYNAIITGYVSKRMTDSIGAMFQNVQIAKDQVPLSSLPEYDCPDPRGGPRPARRPDDGRLRAVRLLRGRSRANTSRGQGGGHNHGGPRPGRRPDDRRLRSAQASGDTSGANAPLGAHGGRRDNTLSRGPLGGPTARVQAREAGRPSQQLPPVAETLDAVEHATERGPTTRLRIGPAFVSPRIRLT
jgi:hypothetical protein